MRRSIGGTACTPTWPNRQEPLPAWSTRPVSESTVVRAGYEQDFWFIGVQIEGQFIFANNEGKTTVNLHAFDGNTFCEVRGTAVFAPNQTGLKVPPDVFAWPNRSITKDKAAPSCRRHG
jgi:hypothetical protein